MRLSLATMDKVIIFFVAIVGFSSVLGYDDLLNFKSEDTDYDDICKESNVTISFTGLSLNRIGENFLSSPIVTCLSLRENDVSDVEVNAFQKLSNLKYLDLSGNSFDLRTLFSSDFPNLETLILDFIYNNYGEFKINKVYPKLKKLFIRNIRRYRLSFSAPSTSYLPSLTHLYLSGSKVEEDNFGWLPNSLQYLDLSGHSLNSLTLKNLKNLEYIFLDNSEERQLSEINFENLINLKFLSIPSNRISQVSSDTFVNLNSLLDLDLSDNDIQHVEGGSFDSMKDLRFLNLSNNNIEIIHGGTFEKLINLETLVLEKNRISEFPVVRNKMKLKELFLNCNNIKSIFEGAFANMIQMESLYLHENAISFIDQGAFVGLENLRTLTLSNNLLSTLPFNWMLPLKSIEDVDLIGNRIRDFQHLSLSDSSPIRNLYLSNQLHFIKTSHLFNVPANLTISVDSDFVFVERCRNIDDDNNNRYG